MKIPVFKQKVMSALNSEDFPFGFLVPLFIISNIFVFFFLDTLFWDDWQRATNSLEFSQQAKLAGFPPWREFIEFDLFRNSTIAIHLATPILFLISAIALHKVLKAGLYLSSFNVNLITSLFLLMPFNSARVSVICFFYTLCYALFFLAWALAVSKRTSLLFLSVPLFWLSFGHSSLLPFFLLPIIHIFYIKFVLEKRRDIFSHIFFGLTLVIPILYWIVRSQTFGANVRDYYVPKPLGVIRGSLLVAFALGFLLYGLLIKKWRLDTHNRSLMFGFGLLAIGLGSAAYMAAGHLVDISDWMIPLVPNFSDWDSRHQMLLPFGMALILTSALTNGSNPMNKELFLGIGVKAILCACVVLNFTFSQEYYLDSLKQKEIMSQFHDLEAFDEGAQILINDELTRFNARGRFIRSYEWLGMLEHSQKNQRDYDLRTFGYIDCDDFQPSVLITITAKNGRLESLLTRKLGVTLTSVEINPC